MLAQFRPAFVLALMFAILTGLAYPLAITGVARLVFPAQAGGSLVTRDGAVVGSSLIGQNFSTPGYFWPRPSATSPAPYNAASSGGSNLGPTSAVLAKRVADSIKTLGFAGTVPADAVTASASGLDPDISPNYAMLQVARVAKARGLPEDKLTGLVGSMTRQRLLGIIGEPRVNVLALNLALDKTSAK